MKPKSLRSLKSFITKCINEEPDGNFCWYNMWPKLDVSDPDVIKSLQKYVDKKHIKYMYVVSNVEEARPQRTGTEPDFYRPNSMMRCFSQCNSHNNTFVIAFWGLCWGEEWKHDVLEEGIKDFPEYAEVLRLERHYE